MSKNINLPLTDRSALKGLRAGDEVSINGVLYTARDQAHKKIVGLLEKGEPAPFDLAGNMIYYCGPTPQREDGLFGSAGPTTASRMDDFTAPLLNAGIVGTIGKGNRSDKVLNACRETGAVYLVTFGGAGAYLAKRILKQECVAFPELGPEAVYRLEVKDFPAVVAFDPEGNSIFTNTAGKR